jgi:alpha-L-fucosidase 2
MSIEENSMIMKQPALRWQDGSPTGNGTIGALMYGHVCRDRILLNNEALWFYGDRSKMVDISDTLEQHRELIRSGRYREAERFLHDANEARGGYWARNNPFLPHCDIVLETGTAGPFRAYRRGVDFDSGIAWMEWRDAEGRHHRDLFCSRPDGIVVLRAGAFKARSTDYRLHLEPHDGGIDRSAGGFGAPKEVPPMRFEYGSGILEGGEMAELRIRGMFEGEAGDSPAGVFGAVSRIVQRGGELRLSGESSNESRDVAWPEVEVRGCDEMLVFTVLWVGHPDDAAALEAEASGAVTGVSTDYEELAGRHSRAHRRLFEAMTLEIDATGDHSSDRRNAPNEELLARAYEGDVPTELIMRMFKYGRYLLVCSSPERGWPANLQGVWNGDYAPAWSADYHLDENVQMNYWQALPGNLAPLTGSYFDYLERFLDDYRQNARLVYGCRGILLPIAQSTEGLMHPDVWVNWVAAAGWLGQLYYDYYLYTGDREFLRDRAVPWLKETAEFYEDFLVEGGDGKLHFIPSLSPENRPVIAGSGTTAKAESPESSMVTIDATMDVAVCREVLGNLCAAYEILDLDSEAVARWRGTIERLPEYAINEDGAIREWLHPDLKDNYHHRHQSHIYPLFPGYEVTPEETPELYEACRVAVEKRLVIGLTSQTGWSMAHMANIYARLGDGARALECLELLTRSSTGPNLFTYHNDWRAMGLTLGGWGRVPPFQIDANFGLSAAVLEMLVFSKPGMIKLFPALPASWRTGRAGGIACRGGVVVDLDWNLEPVAPDHGGGGVEGFSGTITAGFTNGLTNRDDVEFLLGLPGPVDSVSTHGRGVSVWESEMGVRYRKVQLEKNAKVILEIRLSK